MATTVSKQLRLDSSNAETYCSCSMNCLNRNNNLARLYLNSEKEVDVFLKDNCKEQYFPTATSKPYKADFSMRYKRAVGGTAQFWFYIGGAEIQHYSTTSGSYKTSTITDVTSSAVTNATRSTEIKFHLKQTSTANAADLLWENITFYFYQYTCSASNGTGISSASVSNSSPYQGETVTFTCNVRSGYNWDGWYNGSTRVSTSQTYTCDAADLSLEARATMSGSKIYIKENGTWRRVTAYSKSNGAWTKIEVMPNNGWVSGDRILGIYCPWNLNYTLQRSAELVSYSNYAVTDYISVTPDVELIVQGMGSVDTNTMWLDYKLNKTYNDYWGGSGTVITTVEGKNVYKRTLSASNMADVHFIRVNCHMNGLKYCKVWQNNVLLFDGEHYPIK